MAAPEMVGHLSVDSGLMFLGDPCYTLGHILDRDIRPNLDPPWMSGSWCDFLDDLSEMEKGVHSTAGSLVVNTGYGDGSYPVFIKRTKDGRISEVRVVFVDA